jgi:hypothetical protein
LSEWRITFQGLPPTCFGRFKRPSDTARWSTLLGRQDAMSGRRSIRLAQLLTVIALTAVFAWGCGSSGGEETTTTVGGVTTTIGSVGTTLGNDLIGTQIKTTDVTPKEYVEAIEQARPVVILFYVADGADDAKVLEAVSGLAPSFGGYAFLLYDYKTPDTYGDLSSLLKVDYPPELILIDGTGTVTNVLNGYVDEGTINQSLVNLGGG